MNAMSAASLASAPVVVTTDADLLDRVLAVTAAAGVEPLVVSDPFAVRSLWASATLVMVGVDQARVMAGLVLPRRTGVYVIADELGQDDACAWSVPLGAAVVLLPGSASWLTAAVADSAGGSAGDGKVLAVLGGSGGVGASTLAAGLAFVAGQRRQQTLLVDADPLGGGLDLLVGAERVGGWRWPRLANASGHIGALPGHLPRVDGFDLLSTVRGPEADLAVQAVEPMKAVLVSAVRSYQLVIVDLPRALAPAPREVLRRADLVLLVAAGSVRGVAAAQRMAAESVDACSDLRLIVRKPRSAGVDPKLVAEGLHLQLLSSLADDSRLRLSVERGEPPGRSGRSQLAACCRQILDALRGGARRAA